MHVNRVCTRKLSRSRAFALCAHTCSSGFFFNSLSHPCLFLISKIEYIFLKLKREICFCWRGLAKCFFYFQYALAVDPHLMLFSDQQTDDPTNEFDSVTETEVRLVKNKLQ